MLVSGYDMTDFEFRIYPKFKIDTELALEWFQASDNNWYAVDRTTSGDVYNCEITTYGTEDYINNILDQLEANRASKDGVLLMGSFVDDEHIFGEDLNYNAISGTVLDWGVRDQNSWKGFALTLELRALSPTFSSSPALPDFSTCNVQIGYKGYTVYDLVNQDTYSGAPYKYDHLDEAGIFTGEINITNSGLGCFRRWYAENRDDSFTLSGLYGVNYPFGPLYDYPHTVKLLNLKEKSKFGLDNWIVEFTLGRVY